MNTKPIEVNRRIKNNRTFSYEQNGVQLSFTLTTDSATEIEAFINLLNVAKEDLLVALIEIDQQK